MNDGQLLRYSRQIMLPQVDAAGQARLLGARVLIIGAGGLGSPAAIYLASAGVGEITITDPDVVDPSNLQRQILHDTSRLGRNKAESAALHLAPLNPDTRVRALPRRLERQEMETEVRRAEVVLDCSDNFATRYLVNEVSVTTKTPLVSAAVIGFEGQLAVFTPGRNHSPCYRCLYVDQGSEEETTCASNGVIAPLPGILGCMQAMETLKLLLELGPPSIGRLILFDGLALEWREMQFGQAPDCPICQKDS